MLQLLQQPFFLAANAAKKASCLWLQRFICLKKGGWLDAATSLDKATRAKQLLSFAAFAARKKACKLCSECQQQQTKI
jgi:hypothetical protein